MINWGIVGAGSWLGKYKIARVYSSFDQLIQEESLDCLTIVLNKSVSDKYIRKAAETGIPFIAEKPPAGTYSDALKLHSIVGNLSHIIGFNRRYVPLIKLAGEYLTSAPQGYEINIWRRNRIDFRYIFETGIHAVNLAEYFFGPALQTQIIKKWPALNSSPSVLLKLKHNDCEGYIRE